jgi:hypothetical protein
MTPQFLILLFAANSAIGIVLWLAISMFFRKLPPGERKPYGIMMFNFMWPRAEREMNEMNWKLPRRVLFLWLFANALILVVLLLLQTK